MSPPNDHYDSLTLAACVIGELKALFNALALMQGKAGCDGDIDRLIGIGQNIADTWLTDFEQKAEEVRVAVGLDEGGRVGGAKG